MTLAEWYSDETTTYEIFLQQTRPPLSVTALKYNQQVTGETTHPAESRFFQFRPAVGDQVRTQVASVSGGQACLQVFAATPAPTGTLLYDSGCARQDYAVKVADLLVKHAATHIVRVSDALSDQKVRFTVFVECHGVCSAPPGGFPSTQLTLTGCRTCDPGSVFAARVSAKNTLAEPAEVKTCFLVPGGRCVPIGNPHRELAGGVSLDTEVYRGVLPAGYPTGSWSICTRLTRVSSGEAVAAICTPFAAVPLGGAAATAGVESEPEQQ
jgi:hypothetical protein